MTTRMTRTPPRAPAPSTSTAPRLWQIQVVAGLGGFLAGVNTSTMDVALPTVSRHFGASASTASWTLLSYMLVTTVLVFVFGRAADMIGRRRMYLAGTALLTGASLLCSLAPDITWLIVFRCVQAIGAAALLSNITALITDAFPARRLPTALGINVTVAAMAQVLGPALGGALASGLGWRAVFWFNVPIGLVGLVWAGSILRPDTTRSRGESFDYLGAALSAVALGGLILALSEGGAMGWSSVPVLAGLALFVVFTPLFLLVQARRRHPLMDLSLFADRARSMAYLALFLMAMAYFAVVLLMSLYLQAASGMAPYEAGLHVLYVALAMAIVSPVAGGLRSRFSARILSSSGLLLAAAGLFALSVIIKPSMNSVALAACLMAVGAGVGLFMTPNTSSIMASVPARRRGIANGVRQTAQNAGYAVSTALALAIVTSGLPGATKQAAYAGEVSSLSPRTLDLFTSGYKWALLTLGATCVLALIASLSRGRGTSTD
ncbi:DHA2 family efflux MFS transporter permease subunit [Streptomyces arenae]|uniref:DHA2 family efflux MFS transporter permease subunit n=1 Tax=Streptomyces arenae TaxID=29301 RepID=UPI002659B2C7|nr:DHA2 family efflux MFS transporter permease subunit [Streptomyces arenae]MCG7205134.1 DHA2 family efflux MFS transporter permease subunit [Streptomyces arenae]